MTNAPPTEPDRNNPDMLGRFSPDGGKHLRLFVGLWPQPLTDLQAAISPLLGKPPGGCKPYPPERWHITLHFLGMVALTRVADIHQMLSGDPGCERVGNQAGDKPGIEMAFTRLARWKKGELLVLLPGEIPPALIALHQELGERLSSLGLAVESRPYRPHITLAGNARRLEFRQPDSPIRVKTQGFSLVASHLGYHRLRDYR